MDARSPRARLPTMALCVCMALLLALTTATTEENPSIIRDASVFDPLLVETPGGILENASAAIPPVDREYAFPDDFRLDAPFSIELHAHESVLVPLAPIRNQLFATDAAAATQVAIGFELNTCAGKVLTYVVMNDGTFHRFSSAMYQCVTLTNASEQEQQQLDLCPVVHADRDIALRLDPLQVKGFILRAKDDADIVALLRSTKAGGAYQHSFYIESPGPSPFRVLNVTYSTRSTLLSFDLARTWVPSSSASAGSAVVCEGCEYALYAEMVPPVNASDPPEELRPPPPYCVGQNAEVKYTLPTTTSTESPTHHVTLPRGFADQFSTSGDYRFVLVASLPASVNNGHPAMLSFTPTRVSVKAPSHFMSRLLLAFGVLAVIGFISFVAVKAELPQRLLGTQGSADKSALDDDESVRLLAQAIADQDAQDAQDLERYGRGCDDGDEETKEGDGGRNSESLLDVIRKSKSQQATPVSSPRKPPAVHLDGYHEIN